ncbi:Uncharacterized protein PHSC3_001765 [Chlamydiales bacterium STE3]|nr:Uncharacterized protein PHSC3_001765 [Chlamydiales bacterium STE3]
MKKLTVLNCLAVGVFCLGVFGIAELPAVASPIEECSKELLLAYFPETFVSETLKKFNVPSEKWDDITKGLSEKDKEVIKVVEEKATQMSPNPLKDPQQRQAAVKLFRETLLQIFGDVMRANGISDDKQIQSMLDDIQQQKAKRFSECMEKNRPGKILSDDINEEEKA